MNIYDVILQLAKEDAKVLAERDSSYGSSWEKRGGVGAYMMMVRKSDRIETQVEKHAWDVFAAIRSNPAPDGVIDDLRDLRRYLFLVEAKLTVEGTLKKPVIAPGVNPNFQYDRVVTATAGSIPLTGRSENYPAQNAKRRWNPEPDDSA